MCLGPRLAFVPTVGHGSLWAAGDRNTAHPPVVVEASFAGAAPGVMVGTEVTPPGPWGSSWRQPRVLLGCVQHRNPSARDMPGNDPLLNRQLTTRHQLVPAGFVFSSDRGACSCPVRHPTRRGSTLWLAGWYHRRDSQRKRVYRWENDAVDRPSRNGLAAGEVQKLVDEISAGWGVPRIEARVDPRRTRTSATGWERMIFWKRPDRRVVVHEAAHHVVNRLMGAIHAAPGHGAEFMGVYLQSLERWCGLDREGLAASARRAGVKVMNLDLSCPDHSHLWSDPSRDLPRSERSSVSAGQGRPRPQLSFGF